MDTQRKRGSHAAVALAMVPVLAAVLLAGSGCAVDRATVDHRAAVMCGLADRINTGTADDLRANALDAAWAIENERRAAMNLSDAYHWRKATYPCPASRPTTLPWTPEDASPAPAGEAPAEARRSSSGGGAKAGVPATGGK